MPRFEFDDQVEVISECAWTGQLGWVSKVRGPNIYVRFPGCAPRPFTEDDLRHSQQKLPLWGEGLTGPSQ